MVHVSWAGGENWGAIIEGFGLTDLSIGTKIDPSRLSHLNADRPTREMLLHNAFYEARSSAGTVDHLRSTHSVPLSMLPDGDPGKFPARRRRRG